MITEFIPAASLDGQDLSPTNSIPLIHEKVSKILQDNNILHPNQFFGVKNCGVTDALQLVTHTMELFIRSGGRLAIKSADVAGAFPSVRHWFMRKVMEGYDFPPSVLEFFQLADSKGKFCMRTKQSFSEWLSKPAGGIGQGEQGSPPK